MIDLGLQLLIVISPSWDTIEGTLYRYERSSAQESWESVGSPIAIVLGKTGMAWGRGLHTLSDVHGKVKKEGDGKSPAGVFTLGSAFGDEPHRIFAQKIPFLPITEDLECVDDPDSLYYNQFVTAASPRERDWKSSEKMQEIGPLYAIGLVIDHNTAPIERGMGSAVFMHIWRNAASGTGGCTAMAEEDLNELISWLDAEKHPLLVQLPLIEYDQKKDLWKLPELIDR